MPCWRVRSFLLFMTTWVVERGRADLCRPRQVGNGKAGVIKVLPPPLPKLTTLVRTREDLLNTNATPCTRIRTSGELNDNWATRLRSEIERPKGETFARASYVVALLANLEHTVTTSGKLHSILD